MNVMHNPELESRRNTLGELFKRYEPQVHQHYQAIRQAVIRWEYSLGPTLELIPFERLIPSVSKEGKPLASLSKASRESKNLQAYGFDADGQLILSISRFDKDVTTYGENVRYRHLFDDKALIVSAHIYEARPAESRLLSLCWTFSADNLNHYLSVTPPNNWYVRVDQLQAGRVARASTFATIWFKQLDYDLGYDPDQSLSTVMIGEHLHWQRGS